MSTVEQTPWWPRPLDVVRAALGGLLLGALIWYSVRYGVPLDREQLLLWLCAGLAVVSIGRPWTESLGIARDWLPFAAILVVYDFSRGFADDLGAPIRYTEMRDLDRLLFFGVDPTVWLQERLYRVPRQVALWEVPISLVYASHFVVVFVVAAWLWTRDRTRWLAFTKRLVTLCFLAVLTFLAFPAAPPWLASEKALIEPVYRTAVRGWTLLELGVAGRLIEKGQSTVNLVAAVPSLHAGFSAFILVFFWPTARPWLRVVLVGYCLAMGFTLVATGEHYVVDVLAGWAYVAATFVLWRWLDARSSGIRDLAVTDA